MAVYITALVLMIGCVLLTYYPKRYRSPLKDKICFAFSGGILTFISALRFNVGFDYPAYKELFEKVVKTVDERLFSDAGTKVGAAATEKGYLLIERILADFTGEFSWLFAVTSVIFMTLVCVWLWNNSKYPTVGLVFFLVFGYYFSSLCFIRNMLAVAVFLYAVRYAKEGRFLRYLALVLLASTFHFSALFLILLYPFLRLPLNYVTLAIYTGGLVVALLNSEKIIDFISAHVYIVYISTSTEMRMGLPAIFPILLVCVFIAAFLFRKKLRAADPNADICLKLLYFTAFFEIIGAKHALISRFALYCAIPALCVLVPLLLHELLVQFDYASYKANGVISTSSGKAAALIAVVCVAAVLFFAFTLNNESKGISGNGVLPYDWISTYNHGDV